MAVNKSEGIVDTPSHHSVDQTVEKLKGILAGRESPCLRWSTTAAKRRRWA